MLQRLLSRTVAAMPRTTGEGLAECRLLVGIATFAVVLVAVYLGPLEGLVQK